MLEGSILDKLRSAHSVSHPDKPPLNFGVYYKNTLVALCHALEDAILEADYSPLMLTAFQRGKWYLEEADRYGKMAERSQQIVILAAPDAGFGDHPTSQRSNVALVSLASADPVAQEWHLVILSPHYTAMVLCQELSIADYGPGGVPQADLERKFYGLWTFEPALVLETVELMVEHVGLYNPALQQQLGTQVADIVPLIQSKGAFCSVPTADHMGDIVARVVDYLHARQVTSPLTTLLPTSSLDNNLTSSELQAFLRVAQLIDQTDLSNPMVAAEVAALAEAIGQLLDLPSWQLHRLRLSGLLHRMAFLPSFDRVLSPGTSVSDSAESPDQAPSCPLVPGIQVLRRMQRLNAIATILTHQSEWWNGTGLPARLAGDEIPVESRILGLVAEFQQRVVQHRPGQESLEEALTAALVDCRLQQGDRWDPKLVEALGLLVTALQQGLSLPIAMPKIASGLWLLDSHAQENLQIAYDDESGSSSITSTVEKTHGY